MDAPPRLAHPAAKKLANLGARVRDATLISAHGFKKSDYVKRDPE